MKEIKIKDGVWFSCGRVCGFAIGFQVSSWNCDLSLGFWYIGLEY
jgi:hypothetical protein